MKKCSKINIEQLMNSDKKVINIRQSYFDSGLTVKTYEPLKFKILRKTIREGFNKKLIKSYGNLPPPVLTKQRCSDVS